MWGKDRLSRVGLGCAVLLVALAGCADGVRDRRPEAVPPSSHEVATRPLPVTVNAALATRRAMVILDWPRPVAVTSSVEGRELLLRFGRPLDAPQLGALPRRLAGWIESVNAGYDTVLVRAGFGVTFAVTVEGRRVTIDLYQRPAEPGETVVIGGDRKP